jgi:hypothetical protein
MQREVVPIHVTLSDAIENGPPPPGNLATPVFAHCSLEVEFYQPKEVDRQTPHARDEIYFVARGSGNFFDGQQTYPIATGDVLFVPAGREHRFLDFGGDFAVWVAFYGPEGGEKGIANAQLRARSDVP